MISVFELFSIGIGPSSSHTVGPMRAALRFVTRLAEEGRLAHVAEVRCELFGSLGATGHGSPAAVLLGLAGERPETVDTDAAPTRVREIRGSGRLWLLASTRSPSASPSIWCRTGAVRCRCTQRHAVRRPLGRRDCARTGLPISGVMLANELSRRTENEVRAGLLRIWRVMRGCVERGCATDGVLPGGLRVRRRAAGLHRRLRVEAGNTDPLRVWTGCRCSRSR